MSHHITFVVQELEAGKPELGYELILISYTADGFPIKLVLQSGYRTIPQAMQALLECLTTAPPDLAAIEETVARIPNLIDDVAAINEAIGMLGGRLNTAEEILESLPHQARPATGSPLLPSRTGGGIGTRFSQESGVIPPAAPPPIRRPRAEIPHQPSGGAFVPGQGDG